MSNIQTTNQGSLAKRAEKIPFSAFIGKDSIRQQINNIVGGANGQRFMTAIISAVSTNTALAECNHTSILSAALLGESLKLSPSPQLGQYYMVPFKKKGKNGEPDDTVATFVLGYKGYIQLAIRSGYYKKINVVAIKEGELVSYDPLTEEIKINLITDDEIREKTPTAGYYAMFEYLNGFTKSIYWSKKKMLAHADKYSPAFSANAVKGARPEYNKVSFEDFEAGKVADKDMWKYSSFWYKDFDGMAQKTLIRQLISKWGVMSIEMIRAFEADDAMINENLTPQFVQEEPEIINQEPQVVEEEKKPVITSETSDKDPFEAV